MTDWLAEKRLVVRDEVEEIRENAIPDLEELRDEITGKYSSWEEAPADDIADAQSLQNRVDKLEATARLLEDIEEEENGAVFVLQELSAAQAADIQDDVAEKSFDVDAVRGEVAGVPKQGHGEILILEYSIVERPSCLPEKVGDWPVTLKDYLWQEIDDLTTTRGEDLGNWSFREEVG